MNEQYIEMLLDELRENPPDSIRYQQALNELNGWRPKSHKEVDDETV